MTAEPGTASPDEFLVGDPPGPTREPPIIEIEGGAGWISRRDFRELWLFREVLWALAVREVKVRYKQAAVGIGWALVQPIASAAIFAVFLGNLAGISGGGLPYLLVALSGMVVWTYFSSAASNASQSLVVNQALLRKIYFPREVLPLASIGSGLVDLVPGLTVLAAVASLYGYHPNVAWVAIVLPVGIMVVFAGALALALGALNVYYRDVRYALPFVLQLGLFASPIVYPIDVVPAEWRTLYFLLNPLAPAIDGVRRIALRGEWPAWDSLGIALASASAMALLAYMLFKRLERGFADRV